MNDKTAAFPASIYTVLQDNLCLRRFVERFEHFTYIVLIVFLVVLLFFTLLELGWLVVAGLVEGTVYRLDSDELFSLLGYFLLVLIGPGGTAASSPPARTGRAVISVPAGKPERRMHPSPLRPRPCGMRSLTRWHMFKYRNCN